MTTTWKQFTIQTWYSIINEYGEVIDEYESRKEANHYYNFFGGSREGLKIVACAAEWIDEDGNLATSVERNTMAESLKALKALLS